jgi:hypothetical protein
MSSAYPAGVRHLRTKAVFYHVLKIIKMNIDFYNVSCEAVSEDKQMTAPYFFTFKFLVYETH